MRTERFTTRTQEAIAGRAAAGRGRGPPELTAPHLLLSLVDQPDGVVPAVLERPARTRQPLPQALREAGPPPQACPARERS